MNEGRSPKARTREELLDAIVADFTRKLRRGENPSISKYEKRFPKIRKSINELLSSVAMIEQLKATSSASTETKKAVELKGLKKIGDYDLLREIGRGGMGVVFEAVHRSLGRKVAVKVLPRSAQEDQKYVARFQREARAAARLHHSNIVSVFGVGNDLGLFYYVMEYIDGDDLGNVIQSLMRFSAQETQHGKLDRTVQSEPTRVADSLEPGLDEFSIRQEAPASPPRKISGKLKAKSRFKSQAGKDRFRWAATLGVQVADALEYAHSQGILHRDVKPSNLILDGQDRVWITDFGLVKHVADETLTRTGEIVGTPQYMPPESFSGKYDARSETYGLGLALYELVTLTPAFGNAPTPELIRAIINETPLPPHKRNPQIPRDLNTIIVKAISREPESRYQSAAELRDDLRAFVEDRPINARRPSLFEQACKWGKRNPLAAALGALSSLLVVAVAVVSSIGYLATSRAYEDVSSKAVRLELQSKELKAKSLELQDSYERVVREEQEKEFQFARAEANADLTVEAFDNLYRQIVFGKNMPVDSQIDGFRELAGVETVVTEKDAQLLLSLMDFYRKFADQNEGNEELILESAKAYRRTANIYMLLGEGNKAERVYLQAVEIYKRQLDANPDSLERLFDFVRTNNELAMAIQQRSAFAEFRMTLDASRATLENHSLAESPEVQLELARTLNYMGATASLLAATFNASPNENLMRVRNFIMQFNRDAQNRRSAANRSGNARDQRNEVSRVNKAGTDRRHFEWRQQGHNRRAIEIIETLLKSDPDNREYKTELAKSYSCQAVFQDGSNQRESARYMRRAIAMFESLLESDSENAELRYRLALACALSDNPSVDNGLEFLLKSSKLVTDLADQYPLVLEYQQLLAIVNVQTATYLLQQGKTDDVGPLLRETEEVLTDIIKRSSSKFRLRPLQSMLLRLYADLEKKLMELGLNEQVRETRQAEREFRARMARLFK